MKVNDGKPTGRLFVLEGADGVGKGELSKRLVDFLASRGVPVRQVAFPGNESGTLGNLVYEIHHRPSSYGLGVIDPVALQVLHIAAHIDAITRFIRPELEQGVSVVLDRYWWSTWVYGVLSGVNKVVLDRMISLEKSVWRDLKPTVVWLVTRSTPLRVETGKWGDIQELYVALAKTEAKETRIEKVSNDASIEASSDVICRAAERCL